MARRITQLHRNASDLLFDLADKANTMSHNVARAKVELNPEEIRELEDMLLVAIFDLRLIRQQLTATPIHQKGQRA